MINIYLSVFKNDSLIIFPENDIAKCLLILKQIVSTSKCKFSSATIISIMHDIVLIHNHNIQVWATEEEK